jgi:hypothetical protein
LNGVFDGLNGLIGLLNSILMLSDPALIAVWTDLKWSLDERRSNCFKVQLCPCSKTSRKSKDTSTQQSTNIGERGPEQERDILSGFGIGVHTRLQEIEEEVEGVEHVDQNGSKTEIGGNEEDKWHYPPKSQNSSPIPNDTKQRKSAVIDVQTVAYQDPGDLEAGVISHNPLEVRVQVDVEVTSARRTTELELVENWLSGL